MATTRIATQPRVSRSKKSANSPHEIQVNDPVLVQARAVADTIHQLERGRIPRDLPKLPLFSDDASSPSPTPAPKPKPRLACPEPKRGRRQSNVSPLPGLERHRRKCVVCNHADREEIEEQFVQWRHPGDIAHDFQIEEARYIRRHAQAVGLYARRRENYLFTLENLLERGDEIELTASAYMKAVRAYACMCDTVRWTEPAIRVIGLRDSSAHQSGATGSEPQTTHSTNTLTQTERIVGQTTTTLPEAASDNSAPSALQIPGKESPVTNHAAQDLGAEISPTSDIQSPTSSTSNHPSPRLETGVSDRKQRKEASSNRP